MAPEDSTEERESARIFISPERKIFVWVAILFCANIFCLLLLAARASAPPASRSYFDVGIFACMSSVAILGIIRVMFLFPFRLLDLLVMVMTLALGMNAAIAATHWVLNRRLTFLHDMPEWSLMAEFCMMTGCALIGGAAMGLRNCRMMNVERPLKRALVLVFGMLSLPAPIGVAAIPIYLSTELMMLKQHTSISSLLWMVVMVLAAIITISNSVFSIHSMALKTENTTQEAEWRKP